MKPQLVLSLFPGIGLMDMAFESEGFVVVRGPDLLWGGDIRTFHPPAGRFEGVIGGPPCQAFSRLRHLVEHNGYQVAANLIPEFERCVGEALPDWFLMENVPAAPGPIIDGYGVASSLVRDVHVGGATSRQRRFSFGRRAVLPRPLFVELLALHSTQPEPAVCASGGAAPVPVRIGGSGKEKRTFTAGRTGASAMRFKTQGYYRDALKAQGLPDDFLADAPFTVAGKIKCIGNGVPLALGLAIARAVKKALAHQPRYPALPSEMRMAEIAQRGDG
jgi:DNA (cytosine-5)-methyltransferase 1